VQTNVTIDGSKGPHVVPFRNAAQTGVIYLVVFPAW
jgi:hypothetical protein